jgi:hypothetical protein
MYSCCQKFLAFLELNIKITLKRMCENNGRSKYKPVMYIQPVISKFQIQINEFLTVQFLFGAYSFKNGINLFSEMLHFKHLRAFKNPRFTPSAVGV